MASARSQRAARARTILDFDEECAEVSAPPESPRTHGVPALWLWSLPCTCRGSRIPEEANERLSDGQTDTECVGLKPAGRRPPESFGQTPIASPVEALEGGQGPRF